MGSAEILKRRASGAPGTVIGVDVLGENADGVWASAPALTPHLHDTEGWVVYVQHHPVVFLAPRHEPWVAAFSTTNAKVDISARNDVDLDAGRIEFVDVELDVVWAWDEPARIVDWDDLDELGLPAGERASIVAAAEGVKAMADDGVHPFGPATRARAGELAAGRPSYPLGPHGWISGLGRELVRYCDPWLAADALTPWLDRQRRGEGWLLVGGDHERVAAAVWVDPDATAVEVVAVTDQPFAGLDDWVLALEAAAPTLRAYPPPPLPPPG